MMMNADADAAADDADEDDGCEVTKITAVINCWSPHELALQEQGLAHQDSLWW